MEIELARLREMHPRLPADLAAVMIGRAALALERNGHSSAVAVALDVEKVVGVGLLSWPAVSLSEIDQHDYNRTTEEGAEALVLALVHGRKSWRVVRRMQREEFADWLLEDPTAKKRQVIALEVSGVDKGGIGPRLREKMRQVAKSVDVDERWAGVAGFERPVAAMRSTRRRKRGS